MKHIASLLHYVVKTGTSDSQLIWSGFLLRHRVYFTTPKHLVHFGWPAASVDQFERGQPAVILS